MSTNDYILRVNHAYVVQNFAVIIKEKRLMLMTILFQGWASSRQATFEILRFSQNTNTLDNAVTLIGRPRRVMMGYTLLSR